MTESVLASLDAPTNEADHGSTLGTQEPGAQGAGPSAAPAGNGAGDAPVPAPASGQGSGTDAGNPNAAEGKDAKLVPLAALQESREQAKALKSQIAELEKRRWLSDEDAELLKDLKEQRAQAQKPKTPEFLEDPKGYIDAAKQEAADALKQLREADTRRSEAEKQQAQLNQLLTHIGSQEQSFVATTPDYYDAVNHVRGIRTSQLKMMFPDATDAQIQQQIRNEELGGAHQIIARGGNPAEFAYNYAKTMGYTPKQVQQAQATAVAAAANGAAPATPAEAKPDKDAVRTLGGGGGAESDDSPGDPMPEFTAALKERFRKRK